MIMCHNCGRCISFDAGVGEMIDANHSCVAVLMAENDRLKTALDKHSEDELLCETKLANAELELTRVRGLLADIIDHYGDQPGDAPGHCHTVPGKWDKDLGECKWCATWQRAVQALAHGAGEKKGPT